MFIKWLKNSYSKYGLEGYSKKRNCINRINNNRLVYLLLFFNWHNYRNYCCKYISYIKTNLILKEQTSSFFIEYADHSKDIIKIIQNGYGNQNILGHVDNFEIIFPEKPKIEDIGLANEHFKKDYPALWEEKEQCYKESEKHLHSIKKTIENFKKETMRIIEENSEFRDYSEKSIQKTNGNKYYYPEIFLEIFITLRDLKQGKTRVIAIGSDNNETIQAYYTDTSNTLLSNDYDYDRNDERSIEFRELIKLLINNDQLKKYINEYEEELDLFYNNNKFDIFLDNINDVYDNIVNQNCSMSRKGKCIKCPNTSWIDTF